MSARERVEAACKRPGNWRVEGFDVIRLKRGSWRVVGPAADEPSTVHIAPTLEAACAWIIDERNGAHGELRTERRWIRTLCDTHDTPEEMP